VAHAETADPSGPVRALLFWIEPSERGAAPRFLHRPFPAERRRNRLARLASGRADAPESALPLRRNVELCAGSVDAGVAVLHRVGPGRRAYVIAPDAPVRVNGATLLPGERALVTGSGVVELVPEARSEVVVLDVD
jgi:redox-sensitive bicupin YhaK (pirin superfamily)